MATQLHRSSLFLVYLFDVNNPNLFVNGFFFSVVPLFLTILTGRAYDRLVPPCPGRQKRV